MTKEQPFKNDDGKIMDPDIAKKMADDEASMRSSRISPDMIDFTHTYNEKIYWAEKSMPAIVEKIRQALTEEEIDLIMEKPNIFLNAFAKSGTKLPK